MERAWQLGGFQAKVIEKRVERHVTPSLVMEDDVTELWWPLFINVDSTVKGFVSNVDWPLKLIRASNTKHNNLESQICNFQNVNFHNSDKRFKIMYY